MNSNSSMPIVSVIVPMYKVEEYLRQCLDSVVNQTLRNIEILCVDDGSPDRSAEIAAEYAEKYDNIILVTKENGGLSSARNMGLDVAKGRYVYFLDSDDYIEPETMAELCAKADADQLDIVYFNTHLLFENQQVREKNQNYVDYYTRKGTYEGVYSGQDLFARMRKNHEFFPSVCLQLFRREMIEENHLRFYNGIIHEDNLFSFQCMILARRAGYIDRKYYHRRMHGESIMTVGKSMRNVEGYLVCYAEMLDFLHGRQIEETAAPMVSDYLYFSIYRNACTIYRSLDSAEKEAVLAKGDFCADLLLDLVKKNTRYEDEIDLLKGKIRTLEDDAKRAAASGIKNTILFLPRKIIGGFRCVREHGLMYTIRRGFRKIYNACKQFDREHYDSGIYQALAAIPRGAYHGIRKLKNINYAQMIQAERVKRRMKNGDKEPLVSIIMPVYNVEDFIEQGIDSLLNQSMKHIEVICVDDGSTDRSLEILQRYAAADKRVRVFNQQNKGAGAARNLGIANAKGEYLIFLDSDDFFSEDLAKEAYYAAAMNNADIVLFGARHYDNMTGEYREAKWLLNAYLAPKQQPFSHKDCPDVLYRITTPCPWTKMFRRQFVLDHGLEYQCIKNSNDLFFTYSALAMAERIVTVDKSLVNYRVGLVNNIQSRKKKNPLVFYEAYRAWHDKLVELGLLDELRKGYVTVTLSGCLMNLRTQQDPDVKRVVFDKLKEEIFGTLEIVGYPESYYANKADYKDMLLIMDGSFEHYQEQKNK